MVVALRHDQVWFADDYAIYRLDAKNLDRYDRGEIHRLPVDHFDPSDGIDDTEFNDMGCKTGDRAWFGAWTGLTLVDPARIQTDTIAPPVRTESADPRR